MKYLRVFVVLSVIALLGGFRSGVGSDWAIGSDGWTNFTARTGSGTCNKTHSGTYTGTCIIYVSNSGDDTSCSAVEATVTSPTTGPGGQTCATIPVASAMVRNHSDDWLLLNKGDTWTDQKFVSSDGAGILFCTNGISPYRPLLIGAYGTGARPLVKINNATTYAIRAQGNCPTGMSNAALVGIEFYNYDADPSNPSYPPLTSNSTSAVFLLGVLQSLLIEDCKFSFFGVNVTIENAVSANVKLRRNVFVDAYDPGGIGGQGIFIDAVDNLVLYQNLFDHNGWNATAAGGGSTGFSHNAYLAGYETIGGVSYFPTNATLTENIFANDGAGNQNRQGVVGYNNLHVHNSIVSAIASPHTSGSIYSYNVVLEGVDEPDAPFTHYGWGIEVTAGGGEGQPNNLGSSYFQNNIIANTITTSGGGFGIKLGQGASGNTVSDNIICNWQSATPISYTGSPTSINNLVGGSGYTDGIYGSNPGVNTAYVTSGAGTGLQVYIVVSGGAVTTVNIYGDPTLATTAVLGSGYSVGDQLTVAAANIGGTGSGFSFKIATVGTNTIGTNTTKSADCSGLGFPAPTPGGGQTLTGNYYNSVTGGTATTAAFLTATRLQSRDNWNPLLTAGAHNNYVRQTGFGVATYPYNVAPFQ